MTPETIKTEASSYREYADEPGVSLEELLTRINEEVLANAKLTMERDESQWQAACEALILHEPSRARHEEIIAFAESWAIAMQPLMELGRNIETFPRNTAAKVADSQEKAEDLMPFAVILLQRSWKWGKQLMASGSVPPQASKARRHI